MPDPGRARDDKVDLARSLFASLHRKSRDGHAARGRSAKQGAHNLYALHCDCYDVQSQFLSCILLCNRNYVPVRCLSEPSEHTLEVITIRSRPSDAGESRSDFRR